MDASQKVAREPPGNTRGNCLRERGRLAFSNGYALGSFGDVGLGSEGSGIGAYVVVVVVVVTTLRDSGTESVHRVSKPEQATHVVVFTDGARYNEGRWDEFILEPNV